MTRPTNPFKAPDFNEGSTVLLEVTHLDKNKALLTPTVLEYRIDDLENNRQVLDWTTVSTPSTTNTITITFTQNALFSRGDDKELRQVTVRTTNATGDVVQTIFNYRLIRIFDRDSQVK